MVLRNSAVLFALFAMYGMSGAAQALDCPPVGALPGYAASDDIRKRDHEAIEFTVDKNGETAPVVIAGRSCQQNYTPKSGSDPMSDLEIQSNYRAQLAKLGGAVVYADDRNTDASSRGMYTIVKTLPESGGILQYHVKAKIDGRERVVREDQLDR